MKVSPILRLHHKIVAMLRFPILVLALSTLGLFADLAIQPCLAQEEPITTASELVRSRQILDQTIWKTETLAQQHENTFVRLWDLLIHRRDKFEVLREFDFESILLPVSATHQTIDHAIIVSNGDGTNRTLTREQFQTLLTQYEDAGYRIIETEWHHQAFKPATGDRGATSTISVLIHATHEPTSRRFIVRGNLAIEWSSKSSARKLVKSIDATGLSVYSRMGQPAFETAMVENFQCDQTGKSAPTTIHPVMIRDLNEDDLPDVVVGGFNRVYINRGNWKFEQRKFCEFPVRHLNAGVLADFDADGITDFIGAGKNDYVYFFKGAKGGTFPEAGSPMKSIGRLRVPVAIAAGDINGDGSPDIFVGQQKHGYTNGEIPTPYYDAADSYPSYLLINDGTGTFRDTTATSGLGRKARRRNFSASFADLDGDHDLDLLLTSDFWGTDLLLNDRNSGTFRDATDTLRPKAFAFGMSHSFGDYNLDGMLDFITIGMSSTTARRLEHMGLGRKEFPDYNLARMKMGYGNRLFLRTSDGFEQADFSDTCARTGWSWGSTTLDFDRDGDQDIYIVNGQTSGKTTKDYCTRFWCHDIYYKEGQRPDAAIQELFGNMAPLFSGNAISWNGYEHNALLMNLDGKGFVNIGFLMDCSFEFDSRTTVSGDIDGDGRVDLLVEHSDRRTDQRNLYFVKNQWQDDNHWIGVRLHPNRDVKSSPLGAKVVVTLTDGRQLVQHYATGHSVWAQHLNWLHFGIGGNETVMKIEVEWPGGYTTRLVDPAVDQYHKVTPTASEQSQS